MMTSAIEQPEYISSATLMILGAHLQPGEVSSLLKMRPSKAWRRGEVKSVGESLHEWGGWKKFLPPAQIKRLLPMQLHYWARALKEKADAFSHLRALGYHCALNCYVGTSGTATISLPAELQLAIGALGLTLELDVFADP